MMVPKSLVVLFHRPLSEEWFALAIETIEKYYRIVGPEEFEANFLAKDSKKSNGTCLITFDDGDSTVYNFAWPVLKRKGYSAILFVAPKVLRESKKYWFQTSKALNQSALRDEIFNGAYSQFRTHLDGISTNSLLKSMPFHRIEEILYKLGGRSVELEDNPNMSLTQLKELSESGNFDIGAHTQNHPILANETDEIAQTEISESVKELENLLGHKIKYFAYPNGLEKVDFGSREFSALNKAGIHLAFSCKYSFVSKLDHPMAIPRMEISAGNAIKLTLKIVLFPFIQESLENLKSSSGIKERHFINNIFQPKP
jgi:peptidoglycan/xylan/chitin deacetylase (PgdA/CDA1 family)